MSGLTQGGPILLGTATPASLSLASGLSLTLAGQAATNSPALVSALYGDQSSNWTIATSATLVAELTLASGAAVGVGLELAGAGTIDNALGGTLSGNLEGVVLAAGGILVSQGLIEGGVAGGVGLQRIGVRMASGALENDATGTITGGAYGVSLGGAGVVSNAGSISGGLAGMVLGASGLLENQAGGVVQGGLAGLVLGGGASLVNQGEVQATSIEAGHDGVILSAGAYLGNAGVIAGFDAAYAGAGLVRLNNSGAMLGGGSIALAFPASGYGFTAGAAVALAAGQVQNTGLIEGASAPSGSALRQGTAGAGMVLGAGTLVNGGVIAGGAGASAGFGGVGLSGGAGLVVSNDGTLLGGGGAYGGAAAMLAGATLVNRGSISGGSGTQTGGNGVVLLNDALLVNAGSIQGGAGTRYGWGEGLGAGVALYTGTVLNQGLLSGGGGAFIGLWMGGGSVQNIGTILGHAALAMQGGSFTNGGLVEGAAVALDLAEGAFTNAGTLAGSFAAYISEASPSLTVAPGGVFEGRVTVVSGGGTLLLSGSHGTLDMGASFSGFSEISFAGTGWMLAGAVAELAGGQTLAGFGAGDILRLDGVSASSASLVAGTGLVLSGASGTETIALAGFDQAGPVTLSQTAGGAEIVICYRRGTMIQTVEGERDVASLRIGDVLPTRFGGCQPIRWIGRQRFGPEALRGQRARWPVCIQKGALGMGLPRRDLFVSPGHSLLLGGVLVLAEALVNGVTITQPEPAEAVEYVLPEFESHDCLLAESVWAESFADGPDLRAQFDNGAAFLAAHPGWQAPPALSLCAPRFLAGPRLAAALRPFLPPPPGFGALRGCIDIADGRMVSGWAQDIASPLWPQMLEIYAGRTKLGTVLACDHRPDLEQAGIGIGRAGFSFRAPRRYNPARLRISRVGDGASLPVPVRRAA